jgi:hypothetical protein
MLAGLASALIGGCTTPHSVASPPAPRESTAAHLVVENWSGSEIQVYAVQSGARFSLGRVPASKSVRLVLPPALIKAGFVAFYGESRPRLASRRFATDPLSVLPGQTVRWRLEATGGLSFVAISGHY